ncbi:uncharacterized protein LOC6652489 isoform X2 [Drosophila willistoni]|uniref:uncharacterized protein LOC6652489 isoform X2 n=1 Tax=Drosophila willistoni TaxID=7260 RepID=UPI00017D97A3|nr:uncharacterized protein LOC6652489 isoform X2 [Drosophila willistoni]
MGKRLILERQPTDRSIRKRKRAEIREDNDSDEAVVAEKCQRLADDVNGYESHDNDDEDSLSSGSGGGIGTALVHTPQAQAAHSLLSLASNEKQNSLSTESPRPVYSLRPSVVNGTILRDVLSKPWRLGRPIGKGNFGEIFLASDETVCPVTSESAKYVVKIEPHSNGPLFVEIHCLIHTSQTKVTNGQENEEAQAKISPVAPHVAQGPPSGIPSYIASGTHYFGDGRYRFLVLPRFDRDLHSLIKNSRVQQKSLLVLAIHIVNVLEYLHDKGYCHNDIKAQNLMISKCKYLQRQTVSRDKHYEEKQQTTDSGNSSEQETTNDDEYFLKNEKFALKRMAHIGKGKDEDMEEDEDFDDGATTNSNNSNSNSLDCYQTPVNKKRARPRTGVEFSGSNPVRSCRREKRNSMYEEMVKSHYLRPTKRVSYREEFNEEGYPIKEEQQQAEGANSDQSPVSSDNESEEFLPPSIRRSTKKSSASFSAAKRLGTRRQQKIMKNREMIAMAEESSRSRDGKRVTTNPPQYQLIPVEEEHVFLIDFGLASKYQDRGVHRPFIMDQRRAHDGTLEFTSRDAHMGAHSRRSDLECLGYNLLYWSEGFLPWKEVASQQQQEKVHRAKELFMTDVSEMLRQFYGKQIPKYLGEFLKLIGQLSYQERPNYQRYRNIFKREYRRLGHDPNQMRLSSDEILSTCVNIKDEVDGGATPASNKCDIFDVNNKFFSNAIRNSALHTPFQEHSLTNRVSPKNLRSKSEKKNVKKKSFSWAEVLLQDPDQIARERAVKEFEREEEICPLKSRLPRRYEGKATYAILAVEQSRRDKGLTVQEHINEDDNQADQEEEDENEDDKDEEEEDEDESNADEDATEETDSEEGRVSRRGGHGRVRKRTTSKQPTTKLGRVATAGKGKSTNVAVDKSTPLSTVVASNKRGCATRKEHAIAASATGETERKLKASQTRREEDLHHHQKQQQLLPKQRRPRRCLHKTEAIMGVVQQDVENNSELLPMQSAYGDYDDENNYGAKGRNVHASSRHCRK